jgi:hypothetical protein
MRQIPSIGFKSDETGGLDSQVILKRSLVYVRGDQEFIQLSDAYGTRQIS